MACEIQTAAQSLHHLNHDSTHIYFKYQATGNYGEFQIAIMILQYSVITHKLKLMASQTLSPPYPFLNVPHFPLVCPLPWPTPPFPISAPLFPFSTYFSTLKMDAAHSSKTLVSIYETTQPHIPGV